VFFRLRQNKPLLRRHHSLNWDLQSTATRCYIAMNSRVTSTNSRVAVMNSMAHLLDRWHVDCVFSCISKFTLVTWCSIDIGWVGFSVYFTISHVFVAVF